jgi:hypothetical protein
MQRLKWKALSKLNRTDCSGYDRCSWGDCPCRINRQFLTGEPNMSTFDEVWDETFTRMWDTRIIPDVIDRVNIFGYSRTGKTTLIHKLTKSEMVTFYEEMPLEDLIGGYQLVNGTTHWIDGPAVRAMRSGGVLQINEVNYMPHQCVTVVYALMDKPAALTLPTGEFVTAAKGFTVITTMNPTPDCLPHPIFDRTGIFLKANTVSRGIKAALGPNLSKIAENVVAHNQPNIDGWNRPMTVNALLTFAALREAGMDDEKAGILLGFRGNTLADFLSVVAEKS